MSDIAPDSTNKDFYYFYEKYKEKTTPLLTGPDIAEDNVLTEKQQEISITTTSFLEPNSCIGQVFEKNVEDDLSILNDFESRLTETDNPDRKEYVITKSDIELDGTEILDVFIELEEDNESTLVLGEQLDPIPCWTIEYSDGTSDFWCSQVPLRPVAISKIFQEIKRVRSYFLTDQEAEALRSDLRVKAVEIPAEQDGGFITTDATDATGNSQGGNFSRAVAGQNNPHDMVNIVLCPSASCGPNAWNGIDFIPGEEVFQIKNPTSLPSEWNYSQATAKGTILTYHDGKTPSGSLNAWPMINLVNYTGNFAATGITPPFTVQYVKGVTSGAWMRILQSSSGIGTFLQQDSNWGLTRTNGLGNTENPIPSQYDYVLDGTGVDVVIIDTGIYPDHPEFQDADGNSRVVQHNWYVAAGRPAEASKQNPNFYTDQSGHGTHVAGTVAGKTFGWAKNAKIYSMKIMGQYTIPYQEAFDLISAWHNRKPIETETGARRPTIVNCSWSWRRTLGYSPPMIYGGKYGTDAYSLGRPPSVWNSDLSSTGVTEIHHQGTTYNKNNLPVSGNTVDSQRFDTFNTGSKNYNGNILPAIYRDIGADYDAMWRVFTSPVHFVNLYTFGKDFLDRDLIFGRPTVNAVIDYVDEGIQTMIDAGIHVCIAAGNNTDLVAREGDADYNNYAMFDLYSNTSGFATNTTSGWVLGSSTDYSTPITTKVYFNRKTSPYATDAIIVGSLDSKTRVQNGEKNLWFVQFNTDSKDSTPEGDELKSTFSNFGNGIDIYAPGSDIISCVPNYYGNTNGVPNYSSFTTYRLQPYYYNNNFSQVKISGTSMASPQVCGYGALLLQAYPDLSPFELKYLIKGLSHKTSSLFQPNSAQISRDKWGRRIAFCGITISPHTMGDCLIQNEDAVLFNTKNINAKLAYGYGDVNEVNILYNPYSTTLPTETDIVIRRILAADNPVELVAVTNGYSFMRVMWNESNGEDLVGYIVERSLSENGVYVQLFNTPITGRFYDDYSSEPDVTYYYRVVAVGENSSKSPPSNVVFGTRIPIRQVLVVETPISDLEGTATTKSINLAWKPTIAQDHVEYEVRRSTNPNSGFVKINSSPITTTNYSDTEISSLVKYYYRVYSKNIKNEYSPDSPTVEVKALELIGRAPIDGGKILPFDPNPIEPILPTEPPTEPTTEPSTETPFEPTESSPWFYKGNVTVTKINTDNDALKLTSRAWCQAGISTLGKENIKLRFTFENNNYEINEFLAVLCYINNEWKIIFVGRNNDGPREYEIDLDESLSNKSEVLIRFHSFTTSLSSDKWVNVSEVSLFGTLI